jgi:non-specific serine/threonine protein kinase
VESTSFVGREHELLQLTQLLSRARLVTVTGTGGVGKTRLALQAVQQARPRFADGAHVVPLSALGNPALLLSTVSAALGLPALDADSVLPAILGYLRERRVLLFLDTCEHLLDACAALAETLLSEAPGVAVLATSRQPLDVAGETLFPLSPLSVPDPGARPRPGDAVDLFTQRASAASPAFAVTSDTVGDAVELCRRLDGIPLAIELAAVRLRTLTLKDLARQVPLQLAAGGRRGGDARHQTMERAITWSYDLCTAAERALWERLSAFAGSFGIEAAEDVGTGRDLSREEILPALIGLVDKSVLIREGPTRPRDPARYRMLDTIRDFGARRLEASGTQDDVRRRFIARYLAKSWSFVTHVLDDQQVPRFRELRAEHDSIRVALGYALDGPEPSGQCAELVVTLAWYWHAGGQYLEGIHWLDRLLQLYPATPADPAAEADSALTRILALTARCALGATGGRQGQSVQDGREALRLARQTGLELVVPQVRLFLTDALLVTGDYDAALELAAAARRGLEEAGDNLGLILLSFFMVNLYQLKGDFRQSDEWYRRAEGMLPDPGERWLTGWLHQMGGFTLFHLGEDKSAACAAALRQAISAKLDMGDIAGSAFAIELLACLEQRTGRYERGVWLTGAADSIWKSAVTRLAGNAVMEQGRQDFVDQARRHLGDRYDEVFAAGRRAPREQAMRFALADSADPPGQTHPTPGGRGTATRGLSAREREVAALAVTGLSNREIAERLIISKRTVDGHLEHIYAKLSLSSRAELAEWYRLRA